MCLFAVSCEVLIETLWNVNTILVDDATMVFGINRNIVECKFLRYWSQMETSGY